MNFSISKVPKKVTQRLQSKSKVWHLDNWLTMHIRGAITWVCTFTELTYSLNKVANMVLSMCGRCQKERDTRGPTIYVLHYYMRRLGVAYDTIH